MIVSNKASQLWRQIPADIPARLQDVLQRHPKATIFFRADDVAIASIKQNRLLDIFARFDTPLCAAMVPAWMTPEPSVCTSPSPKMVLATAPNTATPTALPSARANM